MHQNRISAATRLDLHLTFLVLGMLLTCPASCFGAREECSDDDDCDSDEECHRGECEEEEEDEDGEGEPTGDGNEACLSDAACVEDEDCGDGARCNLAMTPPQCHALFCATEGGLCSGTEFCAETNGCFDGECRTCNSCGLGDGVCKDLRSDMQACGSCDTSCFDELLPASDSYFEENPIECREGACAKEFFPSTLQSCDAFCASLPAASQAGIVSWSCIEGSSARYSESTTNFYDVDISCDDVPAEAEGDYTLQSVLCACLSSAS